MPIKESAFSGMMIKWLELFTRIGYNESSERVTANYFAIDAFIDCGSVILNPTGETMTDMRKTGEQTA